MSYYCAISFKQIPFDKVYDFLRDFKAHTTAHIKEIAEENYNYVPYIRHSDFAEVSKPMSREEWRALSDEEKKDLFPREFRNVDPREIDNARYWARSCVFQHRYLYDTERQLLCMFSVPGPTQDIFDGTVHFQNSCDQDYDRSQYAGIPIFESIWDKWASMEEADILKHYKEHYGYSLYEEIQRHTSPERAEEEYAQRIAYTRRSAAYDEIWNNYESALYNDESCIYLSLYGNYEIAPVTAFLKACHDKQVEWRDEGDKEYLEALCGLRPGMMRFIERNCKEPIDIRHELAMFMEKHPGYLDKYPELRDAYEQTLANLDAPEQDEVK